MRKIAIEMFSSRGYLKYLDELKILSRKNRNNPTKAEQIIWDELLRKRKTGYIFLRQKPIYRFILDFYCVELNLAIEVDSDSHINKKGNDKARDEFLDKIGIKTIRFTNKEIINNIDKVKLKLSQSLSCQREI